MKRAIVFILLAGSLHAENRFWKWTAAALVAGTAADAISSVGHRELNPILAGPDGRFGAKGISIKAGMAGGTLLFEALVIRKHRHAGRVFGVVNLGCGAAFAGIAARNQGLNSAK